MPTTSDRSPRRHANNPANKTATRQDWRCRECGKLLGIAQKNGLHLRFSRGHEYFVAFPVTATCRGCGTLNQASDPAG